MEIYYRKLKWLSLIFAAAALAIILVEFDVIEVSDKPSSLVLYSIFAVCSFFVLLIVFASTRLYFDNSEQACIQERNHFYGQKRVIYPYVDILNIVVRQVRNTTDDVGGYKVGFTQEAKLFGQAGTKYIELLHFGSEQSDYMDAVKFAKEICEYTGLNYSDHSKIKRSF